MTYESTDQSADERKDWRKIGLLVIAAGILQSVVLRTMTDIEAIWSWGGGVVIVGVLMFVASFFPPPKGTRRNRLTNGRRLVHALLTALIMGLSFVNLPVSRHARDYILFGSLLATILLLYWPRRAEQIPA